MAKKKQKPRKVLTRSGKLVVASPKATKQLQVKDKPFYTRKKK